MRQLEPPFRGARPGGQGGPAPAGPLAHFPPPPEGAGPQDFSRADARLLRQAIRGRWPMSDEMRERVVGTLMHIATADPWGTLFDGRTMVGAAKALLEADKVNIVDEARQVPQPAVIEDGGTLTVDFSVLSDDELERFLAAGGQVG